jgi:hypothetical protein
MPKHPMQRIALKAAFLIWLGWWSRQRRKARVTIAQLPLAERPIVTQLRRLQRSHPETNMTMAGGLVNMILFFKLFSSGG